MELIDRERKPGSRMDHYRVRDDVWHEATVRHDKLRRPWRKLGPERTERLAQQLLPLADAAAGFLRFPNPIGVPRLDEKACSAVPEPSDR